MPSTLTQPAPPVVVLVERACMGSHDPVLPEIARAADGGPVHLVAPARAVPGEEWVIDRSARERDAYERLVSWAGALTQHASAVDGEVGDESSRLALADAQRRFGPDTRMLAVAAPAASREPARVSAPRPMRVGLRLAARALA
jgi:hypothetical protein